MNRISTEDLHAIPGVECIADVLPNYQAIPGRFDALLENDPEVFKAWFHLLTDHRSLEKMRGVPYTANAMGECITQRWRSVKQWLQEHNTSFNPQSSGPASRSWELDPIPLVIIDKHWKALAAGISQRARLLDELTRDIYGPQRLIADGSIPVELVYGASSFQPSMQGTIRAGEPALYLYAVQLCRDSSGKWLAIADRTQGPSGCGYTVENRIALSSVLAEEFRDFHVRRSAGFFAQLRDTIAAYANMRQPDARTVLLSPGVRSDTFFEDAYLARYLGYTLAQSDDLTVRNGEVFQKTLTGLIRVQSVLRRVQDDQCDPLELQSNSGVPGLCQAVRDGSVAIANPIGCGWAEMPAVAAILPELCRRVLGEELILPSVPMHWCGNRESANYVYQNIDRLEIRDALKRKELALVSLPSRSASDRSKLLEQIKTEPWKYIAIEPFDFSTAPVWNNDRIEPWPMVMRGFATLNQNEYTVLDGGIARLGIDENTPGESLGTGKFSKDVWVLGNEPPIPLTLRRPPQGSLELRRSSFDLPSRVAEHLFWLGRWSQRAECRIRHARTVASRLIDSTDVHIAQAFAAIHDAIEPSDRPAWPKGMTSSDEILRVIRQRLHRTIFDPKYGQSLKNILWSVESNMVMVRDRLSLDSYQLLSNLLLLNSRQKEISVDDLADLQFELSRMLTSLSAFSGMVAENMTRGPGWLFLDIGVRIERIQHQLNVMRSFLLYDYAWMTPMLEANLEIMDSTMTYRFRYLMNVEIDPAIDLLLVDESNPRGVAFQLSKLDELTASLQAIDTIGLAEQRNRLSQCRGAIRLIDAESLSLLRDHARDLTLPMIPRSTNSLSSSEKLNPSVLSIRDTFPDLLVSKRQRFALKMLLDHIDSVILGLHNYLSSRFFVHTADVQRLGQSR